MYKNVAFAYPWMDSKEMCTDFNTVVDTSNKPTPEAVARWKADIKAVNVDDDVMCPRRADGSISNDIETVLTSNNPVLQNMIFGGLHSQPSADQDPSLSDADKIAQVIPRNSTVADLQRMAVDSSQSLDLSAAAQSAAAQAAAQAVPDKPAAQAAAQSVPPANS